MMTILTVLHVIAVCALTLWLIHEILENAKLRVKNAKMRAALQEIALFDKDRLCGVLDCRIIAREALEEKK
jgi:hypothetical protein